MKHWGLAVILSLGLVRAQSQQWHATSEGQRTAESSFAFEHKIERVAVIGAGPTGLLHASTLLEHGFQVRLFERAPNPGGQWHYTDKTSIPAPFPNAPPEEAGFVPDIPDTLPLTRYYSEGDDGLSLDWRIREQWHPSSIWARMTTSVGPFMMKLPNIEYPPDTPWRNPNRNVQRHVRQFASSVGLNSNDEENQNVTSYSTRVERVQKRPGEKKWTLTLRKVATEPDRHGRLRVDWWTEQFDAVVLGSVAENDAPWVPSIPGLKEWAEAFPDEIYHGRNYRRPENLAGKNILIVGGSLSGAGISADLIHHAASVTVSVKNHSLDNPVVAAVTNLIPHNVTMIPEIESFSKFPRSGYNSARQASIRLANGTILEHFDHIILATGYRTSHPFLVDFHNSTIHGYDNPEVKIAPIITDGTHIRSLHWTGHYIPDPTLALASYEPWDVGRYQALGFAKVWSGKAKLPSTAAMWASYPGPEPNPQFPGLNEWYLKLFITWLNNASLEFGGRLVAPIEQDLIALDYFIPKMYGGVDFGLHPTNEEMRNTPRSEWPRYNKPDTFTTSRNGRPAHWAEFTYSW